jgi:hypothetical protein
MIRSVLRSTVRQLLGETTAVFWTDAILNQWMEDGQLDVVWRTRCKRSRELVNTTADTVRYSLSALVTNILRVLEGGIRVFNTDSGNWEKLTQKTKEWLDQYYDGWETSDTGIPEFYVYNIELDELILYPAAQTSCVGTDYMEINSLTRPVIMTDDANSPDLPQVIHPALIDYVVATALSSRGYQDIADKYWAQYYAKLKSYMIERDIEEDEKEIIMRPC